MAHPDTKIFPMSKTARFIEGGSLQELPGNYVGIGSYRPTNNGYFGRFKLLHITRKND